MRFDRDRATAAAWRRYQRATGTVFKDDVYARWHDEERAISAISRLEKWMRGKKIELVLRTTEKGARWLGEERVIVLSARSTPVEQYHMLLHECGHIVVDGSNAVRENKYTWGRHLIGDLSNVEERVLTTRSKHRVDVLAEEIDAWHAGKMLAKKLDTWLDAGRFDRTRVRMLMSYVRWTLRKNREKQDSA